MKDPTLKENGNEAMLRLAAEVARVASVLERQNLMQRRFAMGIVFGVGTAIGATIIASLLVLSFSRVLRLVGLDPVFLDQESAQVIEQQIKNQTPQE